MGKFQIEVRIGQELWSASGGWIKLIRTVAALSPDAILKVRWKYKEFKL